MGKIWDFLHPRQAEARFYAEQEAEMDRQAADLLAEHDADAADYERRLDEPGGPERDRVQMDEDYYTQPVGSERHREAHREYLEATGGSLEGWTPEQEYEADNWAELEYDRWQAQHEAEYLAADEIEAEEPDQENWTEYILGHADDDPRDGGAEPGTNEWYYERGYDPEPDWSKDPAVDPRTGTKFYSGGRVVSYDENVSQEAEHARAIDEGRWMPTEYDLGITDEPQDEMGRPEQRDAETPGLLRFIPMKQDEPDPYDPLHLPSYSYWPPEREAGS